MRLENIDSADMDGLKSSKQRRGGLTIQLSRGMNPNRCTGIMILGVLSTIESMSLGNRGRMSDGQVRT